MVPSASVVFLILAFAAFESTVEASIFLGRMSVPAVAPENDLLSEMEEVLGSQHRVFTEKRVDAIKQSLSPILTALPKNEHGKLGHAAASYGLYRYFVHRHGWFVVGLEPFKSLAEWNSTSAISILDGRVPSFITGLFNTRMDDHGLGLHELALLAATLEHLVHQESLLRLSVAYKSLNFSSDEVVGVEDRDLIIDIYMIIYALGSRIPNLSNVSVGFIRALCNNVTDLFPTFPQTQQFVRDVAQSVSPARDYFYYSDLANLVEELGGSYGRWQDTECRMLKDLLVDMEDTTAGGAGRVRLADFYKASLYDGMWQFVESSAYLRQNGALDESNPDDVRVIIPNYINGPSNCAASSGYYSVCCINECEDIFSSLENSLAAPEATVSQIVQEISLIPSSTTSINRTLSPWLLHRLAEVSEHHGGLVPLHGRLFAQWLHYAYPRECVYPHVIGATKPVTAIQYSISSKGGVEAKEEHMKSVIESSMPQQKTVEEARDIEEVLILESAMWTMQEELVVERPSLKSFATAWSHKSLHALALVLGAMSAALLLVRSSHSKLWRESQVIEKYYV